MSGQDEHDQWRCHLLGSSAGDCHPVCDDLETEPEELVEGSRSS